jgi:hypothetical protein
VSSRFQVSHHRRPLSVVWIGEGGYPNGSGQFAKEFQSLCRQLNGEEIDSGQVAGGPGDAGDKAKPDRVLGNNAGNGNCGGCRLGRKSGWLARHGDYSDRAADQLVCQRR